MGPWKWTGIAAVVIVLALTPAMAQGEAFRQTEAQPLAAEPAVA